MKLNQYTQKYIKFWELDGANPVIDVVLRFKSILQFIFHFPIVILDNIYPYKHQINTEPTQVFLYVLTDSILIESVVFGSVRGKI